MKNHLFILLFCAAFTVRSQTVTPVLLSNQGGYTTLTNGSIAWSIGEPVSETYNTPNYVLTMGFHQPELTIMTLIQEQGSNAQVLVFPNPVKDVLTVNLSGLKPGDYKVEMTDAIGKIIYTSNMKLKESERTFDLKMNEVAAGNYFLRFNGAEFSKSVKITKVN